MLKSKMNLTKFMATTTMLSGMIFLAACGRNAQSTASLQQNAGRIVGGTAVSAGQYPSVVSLVRNKGRVCTGNLIATNKVVSAAHCVTDFDYDSAAQVRAMIQKVITQIIADIPGNSFDTFLALPVADQDRLFRSATKTVLENAVDNVQLYFGEGKAELGETVEDAKDLVAAVRLPEEAMGFAVAKFMENTVFATKADVDFKYNARFDVAYLELKNDVTDIKPVPLITPTEHAESVQLGQDVTLVGFGLKVDPRLLEGSNGRIEQLEKQIAESTDEAQKSLLSDELLAEQIYFMQSLMEYTSSGNKNTVNVKLENYDHESVKLIRKTRALQGACFGDSGGPAFVTTVNGELRQLGVIVTVDVCGNQTEVSPLFDRL